MDPQTAAQLMYVQHNMRELRKMDTGKAAVPAPGAMMEAALDEWKESTN